jgi:putative ABC transport system permease protein
MNMQFARAALRAKELAVRGALGASRARLIAQMLTESLIVASTGALLGILLASWAIKLYSHGAAGLPSWITFSIDGTVLALTVAVTVLAVVISGLAPAIIASRTNTLDVMKESGRGHTSGLVNRVTSGLVVGQIGLTCALLIASLLLVKSVTSRYALDFGYDLDSVLVGRMNFSTEYGSHDEVRGAHTRLLQHLRASPQFTRAALSSRRNSLLTGGTLRVTIEGRTDENLPACMDIISDHYFATLGLQPLQGREFDATDTPDKPLVALVNATFARKYFPGESPLGRRFRPPGADDPWCTIVGVVPDTLMQGAIDASSDGAGVYLPNSHFPQHYATLVVRGPAAPMTLVDPLRRAIFAIDPNLAIYVVETPRRALDTVLAQVRVVTNLFTLFGLAAVVLSAVGLYGIAAFSVNQRTQEFGIRMALGARPVQILRMVLARGGVQLALGAILGLGLAAGLTQFSGILSGNLLHKVSPHDPLVYGLVILLLGAVTLAACFVPARRATRVDPLTALRAE